MMSMTQEARRNANVRFLCKAGDGGAARGSPKRERPRMVTRTGAGLPDMAAYAHFASHATLSWKSVGVSVPPLR